VRIDSQPIGNSKRLTETLCPQTGNMEARPLAQNEFLGKQQSALRALMGVEAENTPNKKKIEEKLKKGSLSATQTRRCFVVKPAFGVGACWGMICSRPRYAPTTVPGADQNEGLIKGACQNAWRWGELHATSVNENLHG